MTEAAAKLRKRPPLTDLQREAIAELRGEKGWSYRQIGEHLDCSAKVVSYRCLVDAIEKPGPPPKQPRVGPLIVQRGLYVVCRFSPEEDTRLLRAEAGGNAPAQIARLLDRRRNSVVARLATLARRDERTLMAAA